MSACANPRSEWWARDDRKGRRLGIIAKD